MKLNELCAPFGVAADEREIARLANDSRQLDPETLWLATKGLHHHGLEFYPTAPPSAGILYEPPFANPPAGAIAFPDLSIHLGELAARFYGDPSAHLTVIGVTGTDGKSSLSHFLAQALSAAMIGTIAYGTLDALTPASHTTPDALRVQTLLAQFLAAGLTTVAMETSSHALAQGRVNGVHFHTGVFTNLSRDHLDYHHDLEDYFLAKAKLFAHPLRYAVINIDDEHGRRLINEKRIHAASKIITVSSHQQTEPRGDASVRAMNIALNHDGLAFTLCLNEEQWPVQSPLLARFNVDNLLNVAACLWAQGWTGADIAAQLPRLHGVPGRAERLPLANGAAAIVDYAHTPAALENILRGVRDHVTGKLWCVFGCGGDRDRGKRPLMAQAAARWADEMVITDDNPRTEDPAAIVAEVAAGLDDAQRARTQIIQPREAAIRAVLARLQAGDAVVIAGKGHEDYQIIGTTKHHFSDQETVRAWVAAQ